MDAIAALFAEHHPAAVRLAYLLTGSREQAEDIVAEVFSKLARSRPAMEQPAAYLRRAVANEAASAWRRRRREDIHVRRLAPHGQVAADAGDELTERDRMWAALQRLPRRQRTALVLRYYEDLSERETARVMGVALGTVKSTTARGLAALRLSLQGAGGAHPSADPSHDRAVASA